MRLLITFALILALPVAAFAQSQNPLLSPTVEPAAQAATPTPATGPIAVPDGLPAGDLEELAYPEAGINLRLPAGGTTRHAGDDGWDYSPSVVVEWNHDEGEIYRVLVMVDEYESPVTEDEFDFLAAEYRTGFIEDQEDTVHVSETRDLLTAGRIWRYFTLDMAYDDGYRCTIHNLLTWEAHRIYTVVGYIENTEPSPDDPLANTGWPATRDVLAGLSVIPPTPVESLPVVRHEIPSHGLAIELPEEAEFYPAGSPEVELMGGGPMQCAFYWFRPSAPAHEIFWFTIAKDREYTAQEYREFVDGIWLGVSDRDDITTAPVEAVTFGETEWFWGETGYTDPETPETNTVVCVCQQPGVIHMVLANTNRGYVAAGKAQLARFLASVAFSDYSIEKPEIDVIAIEEYGLHLELPGGGMLIMPDSDDWEYQDSPEVLFEWIHFDAPVSECRFALKDLGATIGTGEYDELAKVITRRMIDERGASAVETLAEEEIGLRTWHPYEFRFDGEGVYYNEVVFVASEFNLLYCLWVGYEPKWREDALEVARRALASLEVD